MFRLNNLKEAALVSGVIGVGYELFLGIKIAYIILLVLLLLDTITGIGKAVRNKKFTSRGLSKLVTKIITYTVAILVLRLLEISIGDLFLTTVLSQTMVAFLNIIEVISIFENLTAIGVPIPTSFIKLLVKQLKIPGLYNTIQEGRTIEKDILEIEEIIKYRIPTFADKIIRKLLEIKFTEWKNVVFQINIEIKDTDTNNELLFYKVMNLIQFGLQEVEIKWEEEEIPKEYIANFNKGHQPRVEYWLKRVENICLSQENTSLKKEHLIESIKTLLYQTLLDAHKAFEDVKML